MKKTLIMYIALMATSLSFSQVGIGTTNPQVSSILDLTATDMALLLPRVASTAAIMTPVNGMLIYDISSECIKGYANGAWTDCLGGTSPANAILAQIGNEGDSPNIIPSVVTTTQLASVPGVTGVVPANQAAYQAYIDANPSLFSEPATVAEVNAMITIVNNSVPQTITSTTGKIWMDRNLGATQVATSLTDHLAYGDLYQWGRKKDGHEKITWTNGTTGTAVNGTTFTRADIPANSLFIMHFAFPSDWRVNENSFLWDGVAAVNNPCPAGFRVPTTAEINAEVSAYGITNAATAFSSPFKFTVQGWRAGSDGVLGNAGSSGNYWSSSVSSNLIPYRTFGSDNTSVVNGTRTTGLAVRCIKN